jgi:hypothetical protein
MKLIKGTDIGFQKEEICRTSTEDLLNLRKSILIYLKSKKLKKRNGNFAEVYKRINEELKDRKEGKKSVVKEEKTIQKAEELETEEDSSIKKTECSNSDISEIEKKNEIEDLNFNREVDLLGKKRKGDEISFPSFLNDKQGKKKEIFLQGKILLINI